MMPTEDALGIGEELGRRFGLPLWQVAMTATEATDTSSRICRTLTGRPKVLSMNECYHGSLDGPCRISALTVSSNCARTTI